VVVARAIVLNDQQAAVSFRAHRMLASVKLIKALGGEWDASQIPLEKELGAKIPAGSGPRALSPALDRRLLLQ
jgi:hypothetical protein